MYICDQYNNKIGGNKISDFVLNSCVTGMFVGSMKYIWYEKMIPKFTF